MQLNDKSMTSLAKEVRYPISLQGNGTSAPTLVFGPGLTITRPGQGRIKVQFTNAKDNPGTFIGLAGSPLVRDATQSNVKNYDVTAGTWDTTNLAIELDVWNGSGTATDLVSTNFLDFVLVFTQLSTAKL
jgi:hypothetical protein